MTTEAEMALGFVAVYARALVSATVTGGEPDDAVEYLEYCCRVDREPTQERLDLARDAVLAVRELLGCEDESDLPLPEEVVSVSAREFRERLEVYGWRAGFLTRPVLF